MSTQILPPDGSIASVSEDSAAGSVSGIEDILPSPRVDSRLHVHGLIFGGLQDLWDRGTGPHIRDTFLVSSMDALLLDASQAGVEIPTPCSQGTKFAH